MNGFYKETDEIYRLKVPFDDLYTSVFLIKTQHGYLLLDSATTDIDVDDYITPALSELGVELKDIKTIVITHPHNDHAGGLSRLLYHLPHAEVVREMRKLSDSLMTYPLPGHTKDFVGLLDLRSKTLISGDGLQGAGVGKYRCSVADREGYLNTLQRIRADTRVENLLFSHAYEPWYCDKMIGRENVILCLAECEKYI